MNYLQMVGLGALLGLLLATWHFFSLRKLVLSSFNHPTWGTLLLLVPSLLRFAIMAVSVFLAIKWGGYPISVGILLGVTIYHFIWIVYNLFFKKISN